jgi:repressor LexA
MPQLPLTPRQKAVLDYVQTFLEDHGFAPSYREIGAHFQFASVATVAEYVEILRTKGYLQEPEDRSARSLQLTATWETERFSIPLMGTIAAGSPIEAIRTNETIDIPRDMSRPNVFALKVRGESMIEDGIFDGDYVVVEPVEEPKEGDIVVALIDNENVTLKRFFMEPDHVRLEPANSKMEPIRVRQVTIQGRVVGVIRKFGRP